jgi:1-deoxyxylulose-5-phosphate synthase
MPLPITTLTKPSWALTAPIVGASNVGQIDDAIASLDVHLTADERWKLEAAYTPRYDFQGISDDTQLQAVMARIPQLATAG